MSNASKLSRMNISGDFALTQTLTADSTITLPVTGSVAVKDVAQSFTKTQSCTQVSLTSSSAHIATNCALSNTFTHTLTESTTLDNPTGIVAGTTYTFTFIQHASSAKTLALGNYFKPIDGKAFKCMSTTVGTVNTLVCYADTSTQLSYGWFKYGVA